MNYAEAPVFQKRINDLGRQSRLYGGRLTVRFLADARRFILTSAALLIGCATTAKSEGCDLRDIYPSMERQGKMEKTADGGVRFVRVPDGPILVECDCDVVPWLREIQHRDAARDAAEAIDRGEIVLLSEPVVGSLVPVGIDLLPRLERNPEEKLPLRLMPGFDTPMDCYERERLKVAARDYAKDFNAIVLRAWDLRR